jgi:2Fe-2S ferredoxin
MSTRAEDEPIRADVIVIGGGIAGLAVARDLARGGVSVAVVEARTALGDGASGRGTGVVTAGLNESALRLEHAIGTARTRELYALAVASRTALPAALPFTAGAAHLAVDDREPDELAQSVETLARIGIGARLLSADEACEWAHGERFSAGLVVDGDGSLDPRALVRCLADEATAAGARIVTGRRVGRVVERDTSLRVETDAGPAAAEVVVFAGGHAMVGVDPWFDDKLTPVREHSLRTEPVAATIRAARAQYGYTTWRQDADRSLVLSGCRWATPHLEFGETREVASDVVIAKLEAFRRRHLPRASQASTTATWARITTHSCDSLPILGPLPGDPTRVACVGFQGLEPSLALACAAGVARGLLTGRSGLPAGLDPRRFL